MPGRGHSPDCDPVATRPDRFAAALGGDDQFGPLGVCWPSSAIREIGQARSFASSRVGPTVVVLAIAGRAWDVDTLFTLSQVSLLRFADFPFIARTKGMSAGDAA